MYKKEDFENLYWNPYGNPKGVRKLWNTLNLYKEFREDLGEVDEDLFFNYMELVYHKESVMVKDFDSIHDRKVMAFEMLSGKTLQNFTDWMRDIINGANSVANRMCIRFCTIQKSQEYSLLAISALSYDKLLFDMESLIQNEGSIENTIIVTEKAQADLAKMLARINELKKGLFMADKILEADVDDDLLKHARVEGITEMVVKGKIKIPKK